MKVMADCTTMIGQRGLGKSDSAAIIVALSGFLFSAGNLHNRQFCSMGRNYRPIHRMSRRYHYTNIGMYVQW